MRRAPLNIGFSLISVFSFLSNVDKAQAFTRPSVPSILNKVGSVENFQLISASVGWVLSEEGLFVTSDGGQSWANRSPREIPDSVIRSVYFVDEKAGWMLSAGEAGLSGNKLIVSKTVDQGVTWTNTEIGADNDMLRQGIGGETSISFTDAYTGWIFIQRASGAAHSSGLIYATTDEGNSWALQPDPPVSGHLSFISKERGWLQGGVHDNELYATSDGGRHWQKPQLPMPSKMPEVKTTNYCLPSFSDASHGSMPILFENEGKHRTVAVFATADAGVTWSPQQIIYNVPRSDKLFLSSSLGRSIVSHYRNNAIAFLGPVRQPLMSLTLPTELASPVSITKLQLIDKTHGWMSTISGICNQEKGGCKTASSLLETNDGGRTFKIIFTHPVKINPNLVLTAERMQAGLLVKH